MKVVAHNERQFQKAMAALASDWDWSKPMKLVVTRFQAKRTTSQQAKIHCQLRDLAKHNQVAEEYMKVWAKFESFWPGEERLINGKPEWVPKSEAQLTMEEESEIIMELQAVGDEFSVEWTNEAG